MHATLLCPELSHHAAALCDQLLEEPARLSGPLVLDARDTVKRTLQSWV